MYVVLLSTGAVTVMVAKPVIQSVAPVIVVIAANGGAAFTIAVPLVVQLPNTAVIVCLPGAALNMLDTCGNPPSIAKVTPVPIAGVFTVIVAVFVVQSVMPTPVVTAANPLAGPTNAVPLDEQLPLTAVMVCEPGAAVKILEDCGMPPSIEKVIVPSITGVFTVIVAVFVIQSVADIFVVTPANGVTGVTVTLPVAVHVPETTLIGCAVEDAATLLKIFDA